MKGGALPAEHGSPSASWYQVSTAQQRQMATRWRSPRDGPRAIHHSLVQRPRAGRRRQETGETTPSGRSHQSHSSSRRRPGETIAASVEREIWGWAWADGGVRSVYVRTTTRESRPAELEPSADASSSRLSVRSTPGRRRAVVLVHGPKRTAGCSSRYRGGATRL